MSYFPSLTGSVLDLVSKLYHHQCLLRKPRKRHPLALRTCLKHHIRHLFSRIVLDSVLRSMSTFLSAHLARVRPAQQHCDPLTREAVPLDQTLSMPKSENCLTHVSSTLRWLHEISDSTRHVARKAKQPTASTLFGSQKKLNSTTQF